KARRNEASEAIGRMKRAGEDASEAIQAMRELGKEIAALEVRVKELESEIQDLLLRIPNIPHDSVPDGASEQENVVVKEWGEIPQFAHEPKAHWDIAVELGLVDFERAAKVTGARFSFLKGLGARLERA